MLNAEAECVDEESCEWLDKRIHLLEKEMYALSARQEEEDPLLK